METSFAILFCLLCWAAIVAGPIFIAMILNRKQQKRAFQKSIEQMGGTIVAEKANNTIIIQLPFQEFEISGAFFSGSDHWFGRDVLELHFALPESQAQLYYCCPCPSARKFPTGWQALPRQSGEPRLAASTLHPDSLKLLNLGLEKTFDELARNRLSHFCRAAVDGSTLILLVSGFSGYAAIAPEINKLLAIGSQMARQIWLVMDGSVQVSNAQSTSVEEQTCPVCSSPVENPVICSRCHTPHCRDCWKYNQETCGVFACGNQKLERHA